MLVFKAMEQCSVAEAVLAYNRGFSGYFFDQSKTPDTLIWKMGKEELSPAHSLVAFVNGEPAGIVLNGIWNRGGRKIGWNGGTGVAPKHRRSGVGQALIEATLQIYREQGVELAALVAIRENVQAGGYALYRRIFDEQGRQTTALLFQCEASPGRADREAIVASALAHVFAPLDQELHRLTVNLPVANEATTRILQSAGFSTLAEQVFMTRPLA